MFASPKTENPTTQLEAKKTGFANPPAQQDTEKRGFVNTPAQQNTEKRYFLRTLNGVLVISTGIMAALTLLSLVIAMSAPPDGNCYWYPGYPGYYEDGRHGYMIFLLILTMVYVIVIAFNFQSKAYSPGRDIRIVILVIDVFFLLNFLTMIVFACLAVGGCGMFKSAIIFTALFLIILLVVMCGVFYFDYIRMCDHWTTSATVVPTAAAQQSFSGIVAPTAGAQQSFSGTVAPTAGAQHSFSGIVAPTAGAQQSRSGTVAPTAGAQQSFSGIAAPTAGAQQSRSVNVAPTAGSQQSFSGIVAPTAGAQQSLSVTVAPTA